MLLVTRRRSLALQLALSLFWVAPAPASEVAKFEVDFFKESSAEVVNHATIWISARRIRIEQRQPGGSESGPVLIYRGDEDRFLSVHARTKSYSEIGRQRVASLELEIKRARLIVDQQLQSLPGDQRKAFERLLGITRRDSETVEFPVIVTRDDVIEEVAGFECTRVSMKRGDVLVGQACVAAWKKVGITQTDMEVFRQLGNFQREAIGARGLTPMEIVPNQPLDLLVQFDGLPMYYRRTVHDRQRSAIQVNTVEMLPANDSLFEVPKGYTRQAGHLAFLRHLGLAQSPASPSRP